MFFSLVPNFFPIDVRRRLAADVIEEIDDLVLIVLPPTEVEVKSSSAVLATLILLADKPTSLLLPLARLLDILRVVILMYGVLFFQVQSRW